MNQQFYFLALNRTPQMGPRTVLKLLRRWPDLSELFSLSAQEMIAEGLSARITAILQQVSQQSIDDDLRWAESPNHHLITWDHPKYPVLLKEIHDPPPVIYAIGDLTCFEQPTVAMVGTRNPSATGADTAWQFAYDLGQRGITIVSGLALGIDAKAHDGCIQAQGKTIAVMGTGIDYIYPRRHLRLAEKICATGLLLSEFPLKSAPVAGHFPRRNRIISGLSLITLVVEAAIRSGSLITARLALEQNRDVLAIPGSIHNPQARGCHHLLQQGARLVTSSQDILEELQLNTVPVVEEKASSPLASGNTNLVQCIGFETTTVDQIIVRSGLNIDTVTCALAQLEVQGIITAVPGGYMRFC